MNTLILGVRVLLFVLSTFGYLTLLHQRVHVKIEFLPAVVFAGQICILFLGGLLNLLPLTVLCLFLGGIILALFSWKNRKFYRDFLCPGYIFYAVSCLYFFFLFKGQVFSSYDNFSHWALVVKQMLLTDRFPNFQDEIILFQSYPLGSSVFIYYVSKIVSTSSEGCRMSAQTMLSLSMILPLFTSLRIQSGRQAEKQKIAGILLVLGASSFLLSYNNWPTELLVDALLPLTGAAGFLLLEEELSQEKKITLLSLPLAVSVILIKNSGIFFWALMVLKIMCFWTRNRKTADIKEKLSWGSLVLLPLFVLLLWKKHVEYVFPSGMTALHSMSFDAYASNIQDKSSSGVLSQILNAFIGKVVSGRGFLCLLLILLLVSVLSILWKQSLRPWGKTALCITAVFTAYQLGNLGMYFFSMPAGEAVVMAGYDRYYRSIIIWCFFLCIFRVLNWLMEQKPIPAGVLVLLLLLLFHRMGGSLDILKRFPENSTRAELERIMDTYPMVSSPACLIYIPADDSWYTYHLAKYLLYSPTIDVHITSSEEELAAAIETAVSLGYDYFINLDSNNEMIQNYCQEAYGLPNGTPFMALQELQDPLP